MKKRIVALVCFFALCIGCVGCGKTECFYCGEMKRCKTYINQWIGVEVQVCNTCAEEINAMN